MLKKPKGELGVLGILQAVIGNLEPLDSMFDE